MCYKLHLPVDLAAARAYLIKWCLSLCFVRRRAKFINGELQIRTADGLASEGNGEPAEEGDQTQEPADETTTYKIPSTLKQSFIEVPCKLRAAALLAFIAAQ